MQFEDNNSSPELRPDVKSGGGRTAPSISVSVSRIPTIPHLSSESKFTVLKHTSTPHCVANVLPSDRMFNVSNMAPLVHYSKDVATIVAVVSAAAAAQTSSSAGTMYRNYHHSVLTVYLYLSRSSPEDPVTLKLGACMSCMDLCMPSQV